MQFTKTRHVHSIHVAPSRLHRFPEFIVCICLAPFVCSRSPYAVMAASRLPSCSSRRVQASSRCGKPQQARHPQEQTPDGAYLSRARHAWRMTTRTEAPREAALQSYLRVPHHCQSASAASLMTSVRPSREAAGEAETGRQTRRRAAQAAPAARRDTPPKPTARRTPSRHSTPPSRGTGRPGAARQGGGTRR